MAIAVTNSAVSTSGALGFTAVAGRLVVCVLGVRNWNVTWNSGGGWTLLQKIDNNTNGNEPPCFLFAKVAAGGETAVGGSFNNDAGRAACSIEITGATLTGATGSATFSVSSAPASPSISPSGNGIVIAGIDEKGSFTPTGPSAPWNKVGPTQQGGGLWPFMTMAYQIVTPASGSYQAVQSASFEWWSSVIAFLPAVASNPTPRVVIV